MRPTCSDICLLNMAHARNNIREWSYSLYTTPGQFHLWKQNCPDVNFVSRKRTVRNNGGRGVRLSFLTINIRWKSVSYMSWPLDLMGNNPRSHWTSGWVGPTQWRREKSAPEVRQDRPTVTSVCSDCSERTTVFQFPCRPHLGLSPSKPGLDPTPVYMGCTADTVALGQVFAEYVGFLLSV